MSSSREKLVSLRPGGSRRASPPSRRSSPPTEDRAYRRSSPPTEDRAHRKKKKGSSQPSALASASGALSLCWTAATPTNLELHGDPSDRCPNRHAALPSARRACEAAAWCGGITQDNGLSCGGGKLKYELRLGERLESNEAPATSWLLHRQAPSANGTHCAGFPALNRSAHARGRSFGGGGDGGAGLGHRQQLLGAAAALPLARQRPWVGDRLAVMLAEKHMEASARMARGPPAFERFPDQAFRYREWGDSTRHGRGDAYPLYTLDTMRNLADHLFDRSTGWASAPKRARQVRPCDLLYSTLRPTSQFLRHVHSHIKVRYLLMTDTADEPITLYPAVRTLLKSKTLAHWYAVDNEVLEP